VKEARLNDDDPVETTTRFVDGIFGPGTGKKHLAFLEKIENEALRDAIYRYHRMEADTAHLSLEENYLIGLCVLSVTKNHATAAMFAKVLLHLGTPKEKILEAVARMSMWIGGLPAAEVAFSIQRAIREYEAEGFASLGAWFPAGKEG